MKPLALSFLVSFFSFIVTNDEGALPFKKCDQYISDSIAKRMHSLPKTGIPFGSEESFNFKYPKYWESPAGLAFGGIDSLADYHFMKSYDAVSGYYLDTALVDETANFYVVLSDTWKECCTRRILTIDKQGRIIDTLRLEELGGVGSWTYIRSLYYIDAQNRINRKFFLTDSEAERTYYLGERTYEIHPSGYFVRYYEQKEGKVAADQSISLEQDDVYIWKESGPIKNHLKNGTWEEVKMNYSLRVYPTEVYYKTTYSQAHYIDGLKDGTWNYYNVQLDTNYGFITPSDRKGENLLMRETYDKGKLLKREFFEDPMDKRQPGER